MKKLFLFLLAIASVLASYAIPARPGWQTKVQADGTEVTVQLVGDENYHYWIDENGNRISDNENRISDNGPRKVKGITQPMKRLGELNLAPRGLVILVNFKDVSFQKDNTLAEFKDLMNGENYNYKGAPGSVRKYFSDQSNGLYTPEFDVYGPVTLANNMAKYGGNDSQGYDKDPGSMIAEACSIANANHGVDFTKYDNDGDGNVDFVYILYAGYGEADSPEENSIWPHAWDLKSAGIAANKRTFDGKKVLNYACSNELTCLYENKTIVGEMRTGIGTIVHEFSHVIGLPDLYDTTTDEQNLATPGSWHVMDYGPYNNDGITPPNYTIYDKYFLGWVDIENPGSEAQELTMNKGEGYQIASSDSKLAATSTNTVYYIENRQKNGWDAYLPGHGMLIWKVKYDSDAWYGNAPNSGSNLRYMLVTAGGDANEIGDAADAFPGSKSKTEWRGISSKPLLNITETDGLITLNYIEVVDENSCKYEILYENATVSSESGKVAKGGTLTLTVKPATGYLLDETMIEVEENNAIRNFTYSNNTLTISDVQGDLGIYIMPEEPTDPEEPTEPGTPSGTVTFDADVDTGDASFDATNQTAYTVSKDGITMDVTKGIIGTYNNENHYRVYKSETLTLTSTVGNIVKAEFTCTANDDAKYGPGCFTVSTGDYTYSGAVGTWSGSAKEISFTASTNQVRAAQIVVTIAGTATGLENVENATTTYKILRNGQILIICNGKTYGVDGQEIGK